MTKTFCFKSIEGTKYDKAVKRHFELLPLWKNVADRLSEIMGEKITRMAFRPDSLWIDVDQIEDEQNKKLFTKDGTLKKNLKKSKELESTFKKIINELGLRDFEELRIINFCFGIMRRRGQRQESFKTSENQIFFKADYDMAKECPGLVEPITEIEYEETYLNELKRREVPQ